jgi:hypothetical protein
MRALSVHRFRFNRLQVNRSSSVNSISRDKFRGPTLAENARMGHPENQRHLLRQQRDEARPRKIWRPKGLRYIKSNSIDNGGDLVAEIAATHGGLKAAAT